ncbi:hypothetical protein AVEN_66536-1 [Araneus ventricosus]|uniref:Uncharacterized protein n=1 Tax=Araneus ventricosus TaxID=182803 RepID=A0A4Y2EEQ3_ARAVE|nr:hypothetical protein AVEN_66536-1 [Araneus ventricosus]
MIGDFYRTSFVGLLDSVGNDIFRRCRWWESMHGHRSAELVDIYCVDGSIRIAVLVYLESFRQTSTRSYHPWILLGWTHEVSLIYLVPMTLDANLIDRVVKATARVGESHAHFECA